MDVVASVADRWNERCTILTALVPRIDNHCLRFRDTSIRTCQLNRIAKELLELHRGWLHEMFRTLIDPGHWMFSTRPWIPTGRYGNDHFGSALNSCIPPSTAENRSVISIVSHHSLFAPLNFITEWRPLGKGSDRITVIERISIT